MQHDFDIGNANGSTVRSDLNDALEALVTLSAGSSEPADPYALQLWADTSANKLKIRNNANNAWIIVGDLDTVGLGLAPKANASLTSPTMSNPTLTGTTSAPTPVKTDDSTKIATTAMVQDAAYDHATERVDAIETVATEVDGTVVKGRTIFINNSGPSGGANGDIWLEY